MDARFDGLDARISKLEAQVTVAEIVARLLEADPHGYGKRGCQTCISVSALILRDFGCVAKARVK